MIGFLEAPDGTVSMKVCTMSFPTYGEILRGLKNNRKIEEKFMEDLKDQTKDGKKLAEDVKVFQPTIRKSKIVIL